MTETLPVLRPGAAPLWFEGGTVGCVCTHGITASPEEMRWLGEFLQARGLTIFAPRLAGHGTDLTIMARQRWTDWYENVLDGVALLRAHCRRVFGIGLSMGGLLTLRAAAAGLLDGAVVMAAPLELDEPLLRWAWLMRYIRRAVDKSDWPGDLGERVRAAQRAEGRDPYGRGDYHTLPTASAWQLYRLMRETRRHLHEVRVPLLLIYSRGDRTVPLRNLGRVRAGVRSTDVVTRLLERSDHCLPQEIERAAVYEMIWEFLAVRLDGAGPGAAEESG